VQIAKAVRDAAAVLLPVECACCGRPDRRLCTDCRARLVPAPLRSEVGGLVVHSGALYQGVVRDALIALKVRARVDVAGALAPLLVTAVGGLFGELDAEPVRLIVVPPTRAALRERGFRPVEEVLRRGRLPAHRALALTRATADQSGLDREQRAANLQGAMRATAPMSGQRAVIVDDILTTGATLTEAARALSQAGATVLGAVTIAAARRETSAR
jgi:predicted amidophosphoribosyltransferase